jgi:hypothetical protein
MHDFINALGNVIVDRTADELIGAVIVALGLSLAFAGLDFISRRKARENRLPMIVVMIGANLASMAFAAGYLAYHRKARGTAASERNQVTSIRPETILAESILRAADKNDDGQLTSEEAAVAAAEFVRLADRTGNGSIDALTLEHALRPGGFRGGRRPTSSSSRK